MDIQVLISIANFYPQFIQGFGKIAALLTSMLKITLTALNLARNRRGFGRKLNVTKTNSLRQIFLYLKFK